ncbi:hypothetical protein [Eisenbergiella tayi]|uniref:hypothetical protein n=1 Tax=Eisenbergiella tayi TaxID=1432052 RepID=UPI00114D03B4|nr:hypothetical protein [Eisenbergiella tayi]
MENMAGHEAEGRPVEYIGSRAVGHRIYDFYRDDTGDYWYQVRILLTTGELVSETDAIFGHEIHGRRKWVI